MASAFFSVFFFAAVLGGRAAAFEGLRRNARTWLAIVTMLAIVVVLLSGILKNLG